MFLQSYKSLPNWGETTATAPHNKIYRNLIILSIHFKAPGHVTVMIREQLCTLCGLITAWMLLL